MDRMDDDPEQPRTPRSWNEALDTIDEFQTFDDMDPAMYSVFRPIIEIFQSSDVVMMTNGAGRHDSYLATLSRLSGAKAVVDLGPLGPTELLDSTRSIAAFLSQSYFVTAHPKVQQSGVDVYRVRPMIDDDKFNYLSALRSCHGVRRGRNTGVVVMQNLFEFSLLAVWSRKRAQGC